ncbi:TPA: 50S ribosomal protein L23 [Candidatus Dependentiae bacterium]|nr:MAG: 50S ribosomal protein L23 [candidate division TM6 bacterium GW2011_GWF2_43_87]HBL98464.1 50S ribosomal protein L23 [Candidatus Dependentiae bacterium]
MELSLYDIIRGPRTTSKSYDLNQYFKQLVLNVHPKANKRLVVEALKKLFNVEVEKVRIVVRKGRKRRVGRFATVGALEKKAIVTLKGDQAVNLGVDAPVAYSSEENARRSQSEEQR